MAVQRFKNANGEWETLASGIGGGGGGVAQLMTETTYAELVALRDGGNLIPGMLYRITDYLTMSSTAANSAGHPYDIIVTAVSKNSLDEKARAIQSARDTEGYFANSNLASWQVWYCLDNDTNRFSWASVAGNTIAIEMEGEMFGGEFNGSMEYEGGTYFSWVLDFGDGFLVNFLTTSDNPNVGDEALVLVDGAVIGAASVITHLISEDGKGVVYRLIDEANNDIPYDFKNLLFARKVSWDDRWEYDSENGQLGYFYTFTGYDTETKDMFDLSVVGQSNCYNNQMGVGCLDNVFLQIFPCWNIDDGIFNNIFGINCYSNSFSQNTNNNKLGNDCTFNVADRDFRNNVCGNEFNSNVIGQSFDRNRIGDFCFRCNFGAVFQFNRLGDACYENTFGTTFTFSELGDDCVGNIFAENADGSTLSISTYYCKLGKGCSYNIIYGDRKYPDKMMNVHIEAGIAGTEDAPNVIKIPVMDAPYVQNVSKNSKGELKIWNPADLVQ